MKRFITYSLLAFCLTAAPVHAACFVEYKAKQDNPLRLQYGILKLDGGCGSANAKTKRRLANQGWTLLTVLSASPEQPSATQRENAGDNYLRY